VLGAEVEHLLGLGDAADAAARERASSEEERERRDHEGLVRRAISAGGVGVTNEPFLGMYGEELRVQLDAAGLGFSRELAMLKSCVDNGGLALSWVFTVEEAVAMAQVGVQVIGVVSGVTAGGAAGGASTTSLSETVRLIRAVVQAAKPLGVNPLILGHGGPLVDPASVSEMLRQSGADGYATGSTGERIPVETSVAQAVREFKSIGLY
jgi:predicted TIM-barrel enzyme